MRRNMLMLLAAALLVVAGCKKDDKNANGEKMTFNAGFDKGGAKTEIDGYDLSWKQNDAVSINGGIFTAQEAGPTTTLVGDEVDKVDGLYKAYYPAGIYNGGTPTLPSIQTYSGNDLSEVNPMYAQGSTTDLTFSNICAVLKLQLTSTVEKTVSEIRVTAGNPLSGEFEIAEDGGSFKAVMKSNASNAGVTLNCGAGVDLNPSTPSVLYVTLPEGDYSDPNSLQFQVVASGGQEASFKVAASLKANMLYDVERILEFKVVPSSVTLTAGWEGFIYNVGGSVTVPDGEHTCEYGLVYCPTSAGHIPTVADSKIVVNTETFSGSKTFTADLGVLENGVEYKVRAYAMIEGVAYSSEGTVKTVTGGNVPQPMTWANGKSPKKFTVASGKQVYFSQGNLQYMGSTGTWKFADHQFDFLGNDGHGSTSETADRDLFGWGTSGYHQSTDSYNKNYQPWATSTSTVNTSYNYYGYGPSTNVTPGGPSGMTQSAGNISGSYYDWGVNCAISNGGNQAGKWRTLTGGSSGEWYYLINSRSDAANLYGEGKVGNCIPGLIILPDDWSWTGDVAEFGPSVTEESRRWKPGKTAWSNVYSYSEWAKMEAAGAVFLPAAGYRDGTSVSLVGSRGYYWSSSYRYSDRAYCLYFYSGSVSPGSYGNRYNGFSVRLVSEN